VEVVVADNAATDDTAAIARNRGCVVAPVEKRCIAAARNGGARAARGEVLCFVYADSRVHPRTFAAIEEALSQPGVIIGATGVVAERSSFPIAMIMSVGQVMVRVFNVDAGVVFCRRVDFERVGGYDEALIVAEDVRFLADMKRHGRFRRARGAPAILSLRKFDEHGDWHAFTLGPKIVWLWFTSRARATEIVRGYWYDGRR
jgi:glycosyltransferase involved in cell wall biosynthesis